jgi:hypothetical protein
LSNHKRINGVIKPSPEEILPIYQELLPRPQLKALLTKKNIRLYWRLFTPLVVLWLMIFQRLNKDHSCDGAVSHIHTGAVDDLDPYDEHDEPLSQRVYSENSSAYVQGRQRLPQMMLTETLPYLARVIRDGLGQTEPGQPSLDNNWKGHAVRLMDGTTVRLPPAGDLVETYGQASNQHGPAYWVIVKVVAVFCLYTQTVVSYAEGHHHTSETAFVLTLMKADDEVASLYIGDINFGIYRVAQVARYCHKYVLLRFKTCVAQALQRANQKPHLLKPGQECFVSWTPKATTIVEPGLSTEPIAGRLIYARIEKKGFRPIDLFLFTTLLDLAIYPAGEICQLYGQRLQVEICLRHIKTSLDMEEFAVKSVAMFRKELTVGLIAYNLICALMVKAGQMANLPPAKLSFCQCWRRIRDALFYGLPHWVYQHGTALAHLLQRLAKCKLRPQPNKVRYEPRKVRRRPAVFPALKGDRNEARQELLNQILLDPNS